MKKFLKKIVPYRLKLQLKLLERNLQERKNQFKYSKTYLEEDLDFQFELKQTIKRGLFYENKIHNLKMVSNKLDNLILQPNEVFSFWKIVGKPTSRNGFKKGRNLINGKVSNDFGGGICQFSSILYHLALQTGFKIIERHSHSLDIYREEERFTPLGADSTVVFGYKDLQFENVSNFTFQFRSEIYNDEIILSICSQDEIHINKVKFNYQIAENSVEVETLVNDEFLFKNFYIRL